MIVRDVGPVGTVTVSGLPEVEDHRLVLDAIRAFLGGRTAAGREPDRHRQPDQSVPALAVPSSMRRAARTATSRNHR